MTVLFPEEPPLEFGNLFGERAVIERLLRVAGVVEPDEIVPMASIAVIACIAAAVDVNRHGLFPKCAFGKHGPRRGGGEFKVRQVLRRVTRDWALLAGLSGRSRPELYGDAGRNITLALRERIIVDVDLRAFGADLHVGTGSRCVVGNDGKCLVLRPIRKLLVDRSAMRYERLSDRLRHPRGQRRPKGDELVDG